MRNKITFIEFISNYKDTPIISFGNVRNIFPSLTPRTLHYWNKKKYLLRISKGIYFNNYFFENLINQQMLFLIANQAYSPSYVSLKSALNYYGLIPEIPINITSITSKKTNSLKYDIGHFLYKSVKSDLMFGYDIIQNADFNFKIATPEKALADLLYLDPLLNSNESFYELRINKEFFNETVNRTKLLKITNRISSKQLDKRVLNLLKYIDHD